MTAWQCVNGEVVNVQTVKYEDVFIRGYETVPELRSGLARYFVFYNEGRRHHSLDYRTPGEVYRAAG